MYVTLMHPGTPTGYESMKGVSISVPSSSVRVWRKTGWITVAEYYALYPDEQPTTTTEVADAP